MSTKDKLQRFSIVLTVVNCLLLLGIVLGQARSAMAASEQTAVLRGRALEIVDAQGRIRASISVEPPVTMNGRSYPETVLLRLTDPRNGPVVKLVASNEGSALGLSDDANGGVSLIARESGNLVKVVDRAGREQVLRS